MMLKSSPSTPQVLGGIRTVQEYQMNGYPDPETAANVSSYPWLKETSLDDIPSRRETDELDQRSRSQRLSSPSEKNGSSSDETLEPTHQLKDSDLDPDYSSPESSKSEDLNMSDEDSFIQHGLLSRSRAGGPAQRLFASQSSMHPPKSGGKTGTLGLGLQRARRGVLRGLRKPIEPGLDCTALLSEATLAFADGDLDHAEESTLSALKLNPEVYQAHNLLSEIHAARGDLTKAIHAAWNGAHTRPRDTRMWKRVAALLLETRSSDRQDCLRDAVYCYSRIIAVDKHDVEARYRRAAINRELGHKRKVVAEYEALLKHLPHDTTVLRHLADIYIEMNAADKALEHYEAFIASVQEKSGREVISFTWSDINILAELYLMTERFRDGLRQVKRLARWLLGRQCENFWDDIDVDDREWDMDDEPRRMNTHGFRSNSHPRQTYGEGLPLEIRTRLAIFRIYVDGAGSSEAKMHFDELYSDDEPSLVRARDYSDLYRESASELRKAGRFSDALKFLNDVHKAQDTLDAHLLMEIASCYRALGSEAEAKQCYQTILESDTNFVEAHVAQCNMDRGISHAQSSGVLFISQPRAASGHYPRYRSHRRSKIGPSPERQAEILTLHSRWKVLSQRETLIGDEVDAKAEASRLLLQTFRDVKAFYPPDRNQKFWGYSKEARNLSNQRAKAANEPAPGPGQHIVTTDGDVIVIPDTYMGITFTDWLDVFLEDALDKARQGSNSSAYDTIEAAIGANVFYHKQDALLVIHLCWIACALLLEDAATLCNVLRWFIARYQFSTDSYQLFSGMARLCNIQNGWFNSSPTQKFMLRQIKALDRCAAPEHLSPFPTNPQSALPQAMLDETGLPEGGKILIVALLMLYGHILLANQSYTSAAQYFLRALSIAPTNHAIKFSLAIAYLHWAVKRQAENRHCILSQGLTFMMEYYDASSRGSDRAATIVAEYNVARAYQAVGLHDFAIPFFERCLEPKPQMAIQSAGPVDTEIMHEAALALQAHWSQNGDFEKAQGITERWLQI